MKSGNKYEKEMIKLAAMLDALSHPARLQILSHLSEYNRCPAGSISNQLPISKSTVSIHLTKLKEAGIITCTPNGACLNYQLNDDYLSLVKEQFNNFIVQIEMHKNNRKECSASLNKNSQKVITDSATMIKQPKHK